MVRRPALLAAVLVAFAVLLAACQASPPAADLEPKVAPPAIHSKGILRVGVDASYPPFAARQDGRIVGLDVDVAAALAQQLGLTVELVDVPPANAGKALREGRVDVALGAMRITDAVLSDATFAGTYLTDGPALFAAGETTATAGDLAGKRVAVQQDAAADRELTADPRGEKLQRYPSLRAAFGAVAAGDADVAVGDAVLGAYIGRDFPSLRYLGQLGDAQPLGVAVAKDDTQLEQAVREALDALATGGVLDAVRSKWVGELPPLVTALGSSDSSSPVLPGADPALETSDSLTP
jgi:polar amino acid transport system substrate-binding protein